MMKPSRRDLLQTAILAAASPAVLPAQTAAGNPLDDARKSLSDHAKAVAAVSLAQSVEPAFTFKA